jgi:hypothetical protein
MTSLPAGGRSQSEISTSLGSSWSTMALGPTMPWQSPYTSKPTIASSPVLATMVTVDCASTLSCFEDEGEAHLAFRLVDRDGEVSTSARRRRCRRFARRTACVCLTAAAAVVAQRCHRRSRR